MSDVRCVLSCLFVCSELKTAKADRDAMKKQSESLAEEYDRVSSELQRLQVNGTG